MSTNKGTTRQIGQRSLRASCSRKLGADQRHAISCFERSAYAACPLHQDLDCSRKPDASDGTVPGLSLSAQACAALPLGLDMDHICSIGASKTGPMHCGSADIDQDQDLRVKLGRLAGVK